MSNKPEELLIAKRKEKGLTQAEMAKELGKQLDQSYSQRQYQKLEEGQWPKYKKEVVGAIDSILGLNLTQQIYEQKVPHEPAHETATTDKTMAAEPQKSLTEHALFLMAQSNNMMAEAMLLAEKNRSAITESNKDLTKTIVHLTTTTGSAQQESQQDVDAILTVVQELLLELGTGKTQWKSVDEGRAVWNRRIAAVLGLGSSEGTQTSLDKMRISK
jgi:transcriptional regulator with XRE-family HTH domain